MSAMRWDVFEKMRMKMGKKFDQHSVRLGPLEY